MDFSNILANEINAKKKDLKFKNGKKNKLSFKSGKSSSKKQKVVADQINDIMKINQNDEKVESVSNEVKQDVPIENSTQTEIINEKSDSIILSKEDTGDNEEQDLVDSITDEQLITQLEQLDEVTSTQNLTKLEKIKHLQTIIEINRRKEKYKSILESESKYIGDSDLQLIDLQELEDIDDETKNQEIYIKIRVIIKSLIKQWEDYISNHPHEQQQQIPLIHETKRDLVTLLYKLRSFKLSSDMLISLLTVLYYIQTHNYNRANESYMKLSIGNVAWPIGVEHIGIHARSSSTRINGRHHQQISNIMINDKTKRWITSIKRLITSQELINRS
ncbi:Prp18 domain-containing protein [Scheffersomyces coipomensis]|uniref:Prp18 domain-containing protein n=1 Tax=Scheffersomyces coipomensis TaxID=1788519 RepID=UPI00315DCC43